ncbi:uncharacterized protein AAG666_004095 [Megaptera novaeangliae]
MRMRIAELLSCAFCNYLLSEDNFHLQTLFSQGAVICFTKLFLGGPPAFSSLSFVLEELFEEEEEGESRGVRNDSFSDFTPMDWRRGVSAPGPPGLLRGPIRMHCLLSVNQDKEAAHASQVLICTIPGKIWKTEQ